MAATGGLLSNVVLISSKGTPDARAASFNFETLFLRISRRLEIRTTCLLIK
jgi:hypothetical protein